ncbi:DUF2521 family protein [Sporolactobacillus sp. THM7-7]|nr:DUF2521 family protein [Sporolactobacillus sp. THM7-7]
MGIVVDFQKKQRYKQLDFERRALRDLSLEKIEASIHHCFSQYMVLVPASDQTVRDMCAEYAMEAFLLGSSMARFGFYGEDMDRVFQQRSRNRMDEMAEDFCTFWLFWTQTRKYDGLFHVCEQYLYTWWAEGFESSLRRWRLKMR